MDGSTIGFLGIAISSERILTVKVSPIWCDPLYGFYFPIKAPKCTYKTRTLKGRCSIQMSYGRISLVRGHIKAHATNHYLQIWSGWRDYKIRPLFYPSGRTACVQNRSRRFCRTPFAGSHPPHTQADHRQTPYHCLEFGRGGGIRTPDPLLPKQLRYQAALHPESLSHQQGAE